MSFEAVVQQFEGSKCSYNDFIDFRADRVKEILGPNADDIPYEYDFKSLRRKWKLGYEVLRYTWQTARTIPVNIRDSDLTNVRFYLPFLGAEDVEAFVVSSQENIGGKRPNDYSVDAILTNLVDELKAKPELTCPTMRRRPFALANDFIRYTLSPYDITFDEAVVEGCRTEAGDLYIGDFFRLARVNRLSDPQDSTIDLKVFEDSAFVNLGIRLISTDPSIQALKTFKDIKTARRSKKAEFGDMPIRAISWLVQRRTSSWLNKIGIPSEGVPIGLFDLNKVLSSENAITFREEEWFELIAASVEAIVVSATNLRRFLISGELPDVGVMEIPSNVFFLQDSAAA